MGRTSILTDKAEVVASDNIGDGDFDTSVSQLKSVTDDDWCLDVTGPQKYEAVIVRDLGWFAREVPIERRNIVRDMMVEKSE